ncbi:EscU/YscU/HrcU family type III secretion system export apparatus switch protein [Helicovermis profundi]|uniref:EscU/YscU/HrcU family type III secretion system export apparatus switch protein n=1 Tax=Helicovermis profundi TaxID=3065157 RepID=A0AAU9E9F9_9FIRM|nr:EscU/YscU/HrcU family type III secretion system export apparatus switch protein [Clostridia bacterium S502]
MKEKNKLVTALKYDALESAAPIVVAKGRGVIAEKILEVANDNDIPKYKDEKLANQLYNLSIGEEIPVNLYNVVAEVLSFIAKMDKEYE